MKRSGNRLWLWVAVGLLVGSTGLTLWSQWYRLFPTHEVSEVYADYAGREGYRAAFLKDYRVGDSVRVDATLIEAITDSAWEALKADFGVPPIPDEYRELFASGASVTFWLASGRDPRLPMDTASERNAIVLMWNNERNLCVFHTTSRAQQHAIVDYNFEQLNKQQ